LRCRLGTAQRVVECGGDEILEHVAVLAEQRRIDRHALDVVAARHRDLDEPRARLALDLGARELLLRTLHVFLHLLRLLHQAGQLVLHHGVSCLVDGVDDGSPAAESIVSGRTVASNRATRSRTNGSLRKAASPSAFARARSRRSIAASEASLLSPISKASSSLRPVVAS